MVGTEMAGAADEALRRVSVRVWDLPVRVFHWGLVLLIASLWLSGENGWFVLHFWCGYAVLALVVFRLVWGVIGGPAARFAGFVRGPLAAIAHLQEVRAAIRAKVALAPHPGHNPAGAYMVLVLLALVTVQATTGLFATDDILVDGPLNRLVSGATAKALTRLHNLNFDLILIAVCLHVAAVATYRLLLGLDLVRPMLTGRMSLPAGAVTSPADWGPARGEAWRAALALALAIAAVAALTQGLPRWLAG